MLSTYNQWNAPGSSLVGGDDEPRQSAMRSARRQLVAGGAIFVAGVVLSIVSTDALFWGAIVFGPVRAGRAAVRLLRLAALRPGTAVATSRRRRWLMR